jgi:hypothetical protein
MCRLEPALQIRWADALLAIAQLDHACEQLVEQLALALWSQLHPQRPQVMRERSTPRELAQRIFPPSGKALRCKLRAVQCRLRVAIGMDACRLREDARAQQRSVVCHPLAAGGRYALAQLIQVSLVHARVHTRVVA